MDVSFHEFYRFVIGLLPWVGAGLVLIVGVFVICCGLVIIKIKNRELFEHYEHYEKFRDLE